MVALGWVITVLGLALTAYVLIQKGRGVLNYWIRPVSEPEQFVLGRTMPLEPEGTFGAQILIEISAHLRSIEQESTRVLRIWRPHKNEAFVGLVVDGAVENCGAFELLELPERSLLRASGANSRDELDPSQALIKSAHTQQLSFQDQSLERLSGQSFAAYQRPIQEQIRQGAMARLAEKTEQIRDIFIFPILATIVTTGLLMTKQPALFAVGIVSITFLSGACKFVFLHQRNDESQEVHLQNY